MALYNLMVHFQGRQRRFNLMGYIRNNVLQKFFVLPLVLGMGYMGAYFLNYSSFDFVLVSISALGGYMASKLSIPIPPLVLALILGGMTGPLTFYAPWVVALSHVFPLTWEFHFQRDIIARGAGFFDISTLFGAFLLYLAAIAVAFILRFRSARRQLLAQQAAAERHREKFKQLAQE
mgnify:CR=1 FL=1